MQLCGKSSAAYLWLSTIAILYYESINETTAASMHLQCIDLLVAVKSYYNLTCLSAVTQEFVPSIYFLGICYAKLCNFNFLLTNSLLCQWQYVVCSLLLHTETAGLLFTTFQIISIIMYNSYHTVLYNYRDHEGQGFLATNYHPKTSLIFAL